MKTSAISGLNNNVQFKSVEKAEVENTPVETKKGGKGKIALALGALGALGAGAVLIAKKGKIPAEVKEFHEILQKAGINIDIKELNKKIKKDGLQEQTKQIMQIIKETGITDELVETLKKLTGN